MEENTSGAENTYLGYSAGWKNQTGDKVTAVGYEAGAYATASGNTLVGTEAGRGSNSAPYTSGDNNTALGYRALYSFTTSRNNVAVGWQTLYNVTTGNSNTAIGQQAGNNVNTGTQNVFVGLTPDNLLVVRVMELQ